MIYNVVEKFISINGEGTKAGELAAFIRLGGCNLNCSYCDTKWANSSSAPAEQLDEQSLCEFAEKVHNVTITGGEPMLYDLGTLVSVLMKKGHYVEIETNGSVRLDKLSYPRPAMTVDYKLPSSGMEKYMLTENFDLLAPADTVKFVSGSKKDLERALQIIKKYELTEKCNVYISPVFGEIEPSEIVDFMKENDLNGVRLQLQLHKYIWDPMKRGV